MAEQRRVVARIEELAAQVQQARILRIQASQEAEGLLSCFLRSILHSCPADEIKLEEACDEIIDNLHSNPRYAAAGIPCVRSPDVGWGTLKLENALRTDEAEYRHRTARGEPRAGDIVFVREGGGTGKCALVPPRQRFSLGQRVMMLRPNEQKVLPQFLLYQLLSPLVQDDQIQPLCMGLASPLVDQRRIVTEVDALRAEADTLKELQAESYTELDALLPAILDRAFNGGWELRTTSR